MFFKTELQGDLEMASTRQQTNSGKQDISAGTEELKNLLNQIEVLSAQAKGGGGTRCY